MDNLPTNFGVSGTFRSRLISQHLSDASRELATLTFDLGGHDACCWCGSSCSVRVPNLNFVGLPVRKLLRIYCVNISRPGDLDLWPWNWCALLPVGWTTFQAYTNFGVARTFRSRLIGQHISDASRDLATLTFDLGGNGACRWCGSLCFVCVPCLNFVGLPVRKILRIYCVSINRPGELDLWPFDFK